MAAGPIEPDTSNGAAPDAALTVDAAQGQGLAGRQGGGGGSLGPLRPEAEAVATGSVPMPANMHVRPMRPTARRGATSECDR